MDAGELGEGPRLAPAQGAHGVGCPFLGALPEDPEYRDDLARDELRYPGPHEGLSRRIVGHGNEPDAPARRGGKILGDALEGEVEDAAADGQTVALRGTMRGKHEGELLGIAPTGERVGAQRSHWLRVEDGKIAEHWAVRDDLVMLRQLGVMPP